MGGRGMRMVSMKCMLVELPSGSFDKAADADTPSGDEWLILLQEE